MRAQAGLLAVAFAAGLAAASTAHAACDRHLLAEIPVTVTQFRPIVTAQINDLNARMLFDTGASDSFMFPGAEDGFHLTPDPNHPAAQARSNGRDVSMRVVDAARFAFAGETYGPVMFADPGSGFERGIDGVIGQNHMRDADQEIDLAHGVIRFFAPRGCASANLAYWRGRDAASVIEIEDPTSAAWPRTFGSAKLNGVPLRVLFDTGTPRSQVTREAAYRAGVDAAAIAPKLAHGSTGVGGGPEMTNWRTGFTSFQAGDERVADPTFNVVDKPNASADMILGFDFFLSHRVLISKSQHRLYFTANPGNTFGQTPKAPAAATPPPGPAPAP